VADDLKRQRGPRGQNACRSLARHENGC
jgi:hypothetical protein